MKRFLFLSLLLLTACTVPAQPTPNTQATVDAAVLATQAAQPTATLLPSPTPTAQPTATPVPPTATPYPTDTPSPTSTSTPTSTPLPTSTTAPTATPKPTQAPTKAAQVEPTRAAPQNTPAPAAPTATVKPPPAGTGKGITPIIEKVGYQRWGRPLVMTNPDEGNCNRNDDSHPMLNLQVSLAFVNNTGQTWTAQMRRIGFTKTDGEPAFWCYYGFVNWLDYPETKPGETFQYTFNVYVEPTERVGSAVFLVEGVDIVRVPIPQDLPVP